MAHAPVRCGAAPARARPPLSCRARLPGLRLAGLGAIVACLLAALAATPAFAQISAPSQVVHRKHRRRWHTTMEHPATAGLASVCANANTPVTAAPAETMDAAVLCLVNFERDQHGLSLLHNQTRLDSAAQRWTNWMVSTDRYTHGSNFAGRLMASGYPFLAAGEDIDTGSPTPSAVVTAWMDSAPHCRNILAPLFRDIGIGVSPLPVSEAANFPGTWTLDLGLSRSETAPSQNWSPADGCPY